MNSELQNATRNEKPDDPSEDGLTQAKQASAAESDALLLHVARVATLADQCEQEGNPGTAVALRRVAEALWGETFRCHSLDAPDRK